MKVWIRKNCVQIFIVFTLFILLGDVYFLIHKEPDEPIVQVNYLLDNMGYQSCNERMTLTFFIPGEKNFITYEGIKNDAGMEVVINNDIQKYDLCAIDFYNIDKGVLVQSIQSRIKGYKDVDLTCGQISDLINIVDAGSFTVQNDFLYFEVYENEFGIQLSKDFINAIGKESHKKDIIYIILKLTIAILNLMWLVCLLFIIYECYKEHSLNYMQLKQLIHNLKYLIKEKGLIIYGLLILSVLVITVKSGISSGDYIREETQLYDYQLIGLIIIVFIFAVSWMYFASSKKFLSNRIVQLSIPIFVLILSIWTIELMMGNSKIECKFLIANFIIGFFIYNVINLIVSECKCSMIIYTLFCFIYGTISYFVLQIRGIPFLPQDIKSIGVARSVVKNYTFYIDFYFLCGITLFLCQMMVIFYGMEKKIIKRKASFIGVMLLGFLLQNGFILNFFNINVNAWSQQEGFKTYGHMASFCANVVLNRVTKPKGYEKEEVIEIINGYKNGRGIVPEDPANIVVVMNEAFSDLSIISDFGTNQEVMPYFDSLEGNAIKGNLFVSIVGGNTCNTEFEFLTGNTMAFLPPNSVAFQSYIDKPVESIARKIKKYGYKTIGIHPYFGGGWSRNTVYPMLGIDDFYDITVFDENVEYIRSYVSDKSNYKKVLECIEQEEAPVFLFNVTMQNHGGYNLNYTDLSEDISLEGNKNDYPQTEQYLNLISISDGSLQEFVDSVQALDEKTIICFFGDHQPFVEDDFITELYKKEEKLRSLEEKQKRYCVPYAIIANFDLQAEGFTENLSANFLGMKLLKAAGYELGGYYEFLDKLSKSYPAINANGCMDANGNWYEWDEMKNDDELSMYRKIQYGVLFDHIISDTKGWS